MKKHILFFLTMIMASAMFAGTPVSTTKIEVYYFHFTRRCMTCQNVENVSKKAVETLYPEKVKSGQITFQSINLDEKAGEAVGAKYKIEGQTLIVIAGEKKVDLTDKGFLYANDSPDKLKAEIKKAVDGFLK
jgi:hypothetical protein